VSVAKDEVKDVSLLGDEDPPEEIEENPVVAENVDTGRENPDNIEKEEKSDDPRINQLIRQVQNKLD
jgi:hypothetical protein